MYCFNNSFVPIMLCCYRSWVRDKHQPRGPDLPRAQGELQRADQPVDWPGGHDQRVSLRGSQERDRVDGSGTRVSVGGGAKDVWLKGEEGRVGSKI